MFFGAIGNEWDALLVEEFTQPYMVKLDTFLEQEYSQYNIFPPKGEVFSALRFTPYSNVRVVILGQDPYIRTGQAHGLAFSVRSGKLPPSLKNIFKEIADEGGSAVQKDGNLIEWAERGVLLLNTVLTVREGQSDSHKAQGWETFTDRIIALLNEKKQPTVFLLWGNNAQKKRSLITNPKHLVLTAAHPSPLSANRGFFGCGHFVKTVEFLLANNVDFEGF